jgi:diguanylate cyclase (GGDEF)-like protein
VSELLDIRPLPREAGPAINLLREEEDASRLKTLASYEILDSEAEKSYDDIARLAAYVCAAPAGIISFFGESRQWVKSLFCTGAFAGKALDFPYDGFREANLHEPGSVLQLPDMHAAPQFGTQKRGHTRPRFYAAAPLYSPAGEILGSVSVLDRRARSLNEEQCHALETLARQVMELLEMRRTLIGLSMANAKLGQQNVTDALTGIPNRRAYDQKLSEEYSRAKRTGAALSLLMLDIDNFKQYNDNFGHLAGDSALQSVARVLLSSLRPYDFLARYGGEEFAIILPSTDLADAIVVAERVRGLVAASEFPHRKFTISVGVSRLDVDAGTRALVQAADNGLYRAKASGRNKVVVGRLNDHSPVGSATP